MMIEYIIITILTVLCLGLSIYIYHNRMKQKELLAVLKVVKQGENRKNFATGNSLVSEICYNVNEIVENHRSKIAELHKKEEANKELLTSLSHDVRTPLASLLGYLDALEDGLVDNEERERYIKIARKKAYNLKSLVDTLFDWFKLNSREMAFHFEAIDINELSREIIIEWLPLLEEKKIQLEVLIPEKEFLVILDKSAYSRILNNLMQNAVMHGRCSLLKIAIQRKNSVVVLSVIDNGSGIPEDKLPYIFERLYKCDAARRDRGSGLGLAIVKELVRAHQGKIEVRSVPHKNTIFTIEFPCQV